MIVVVMTARHFRESRNEHACCCMSLKTVGLKSYGSMKSDASCCCDSIVPPRRMTRALTAEELAEILGVSRLTLLRWAKRGKIPSFRKQNLVRFDGGNVA